MSIMKEKNLKFSASSEEYRYLKPCSTQDMTGLIPAGPVDEHEMEHYEALYPFLPEVPKSSKNMEPSPEPPAKKNSYSG